jgi:hypothetical protein
MFLYDEDDSRGEYDGGASKLFFPVVPPEHNTIGGAACLSVTQTLLIRQGDFGCR